MRCSGLVCVVVVFAAAACSFDKTGAAADGGGGAADSGPGADAGGVDAAAVCTERCDGATLVECIGGDEQRTPCDVDCSETGGPHCGTLVPSNGVDPDLVDGVPGGLHVGEGQIGTIEADSGRIVVNGLQVRAAGEGVVDGVRYVSGPPYNIFVFDRLRIERDGTLLIRAPSSQAGVTSPIIIYVGRDAEINGLIDITAGCADTTHWCAGVGGGNGGTTTYLPGGCAPGGAGGDGALLQETGGGGGGLGQSGAAGGDSGDLLGGAGGDPAECPGPTLVPLEGGSGGDLGGEGGRGGGGGGGLQLTARQLIRIRPAGGGVTPGIWAGGDGGEAGGAGSGGGGGGSGGAILLEAPVVELAIGSILAANGGGGGEGNGYGPGQDGLLASAPAGGGGGEVVQHGGKGGYGTTDPERGDGPGDGTGGGGGGAGLIRINARDSTVDGVLSPPASVGPLTVE